MSARKPHTEAEPSAAGSFEAETERFIAQTLALLPWRKRLRLRWSIWRGRFWLWMYNVPGWAQLVRLTASPLFRLKRQGLSGLWEPLFSPSAYPHDCAFARPKWHGWGVFADGEGYRAHTPTSRTAEVFPCPEGAWEALESVYWLGSRSPFAWERCAEKRA